MLVQCPQCSAAYEFPAERLPEDGLRAKCARCGCIMRVRPPTPDGEARVERSNALVRRPGRALNTAQSVPPKVLDAPAETPSANACELMCQPSANSAMEPSTVPAAISTTIITSVSHITWRVRRSAMGLLVSKT